MESSFHPQKGRCVSQCTKGFPGISCYPCQPRPSPPHHHHHHVCGVPCRLGSPVALSGALLVHWDICSCTEQLKEKTHVCPWKGKKKKLDWHWKDRVLTRRPRWPKISCSKKDARHDDKVLTCLGSLIHLALNCATFCATNLHLSRVCKDQENAHFLSMSPQGLLRDHDLTMGWGYKGLFTGVSVCVLGFVWAFVEDHILFCRIHVHVCPSVECNIRKPRSCNLTGCCSD